ncbi:MAG: hypothetical protein H6730_24315 [Deltaproteobacteria bacterium]|nr:hypothetical protein [Deltaproteobacteria bacterium]
MLAALWAAPAAAKPSYPGELTDDAALKALATKVGAKQVPIEHPEALARTVKRLKAGEPVRILQLGDSHIAADYITGMIRARLQAKYGDGGRGFTHIDQKWGFGGRRTSRKDADWTQTRVVDKAGPGKPFGFSGMSLVAKKAGAKVSYRVLPGDRSVRIYYQQHPKGGAVEVRLGKTSLGTFETAGPVASKVHEVKLTLEGAPPEKKKGPAGWSLTLEAQAGAQLFGISFEGSGRGVTYESVGPVGADAKLYLETGRDSFVEHLKAHAPDLVILMVGGNDALKTRKKWTDLKKVEQDHRDLVALIKSTLPEAEILIWGPMDAGDREGKKVVSKAYLEEIRDMQRTVADETKVAFWDTLAAMGGAGAIARWDAAKVMNKDLVHPKKRAADLLGDLFARALLAL